MVESFPLYEFFVVVDDIVMWSYDVWEIKKADLQKSVSLSSFHILIVKVVQYFIEKTSVVVQA